MNPLSFLIVYLLLGAVVAGYTKRRGMLVLWFPAGGAVLLYAIGMLWWAMLFIVFGILPGKAAYRWAGRPVRKRRATTRR